MDGKTKTTGEVYRGEAADLMAAAARTGQPARPAPTPFPRRPAAPLVQPESRRPLPYPEPVGINDNLEDDEPAVRPIRETRRFSPLRLIARIVIAPLYLVVAAGSIGVIVLFVRSLLGV